MAISDLDEIRSTVGTERIAVLTDLFQNSAGTPPGIQVDRYRADHPKWFDVLDRLEADQLFLHRQQNNYAMYEVRVYALPLLNDTRASRLLSLMEDIYRILQSIYLERLTKPIAIDELAAQLDGLPSASDEVTLKQALYMMTDSHGVWSGISAGFPYAEGGHLSVSESVLKYDKFLSVIDQSYDWHIRNPKKLANASPLDAQSDIAEPQIASFGGSSNEVRPEWYKGLSDKQVGLLDELDTALRSGLSALPTMGLRTLLESIILDHVPPQKTFKLNLAAFAEAGWITRNMAQALENVVDAGHAAVHRAYFPNRSDLDTCVKAVKHVLEAVYILKPKIDAIAANTPERPKGG